MMRKRRLLSSSRDGFNHVNIEDLHQKPVFDMVSWCALKCGTVGFLLWMCPRDGLHDTWRKNEEDIVVLLILQLAQLHTFVFSVYCYLLE
jgi:hypothetical protein